jgi:hypothetical protein
MVKPWTWLVIADAGSALKASVAAQAAITGMRRSMEGSRWVNARQKTTYITGSPFGAE